jgi:hypothetical protein
MGAALKVIATALLISAPWMPVLAEVPACVDHPGYYTNVDGKQVHRPVCANSAPPGATAQCRDGSYSFSLHHSGTCSGHGGVHSWLGQ